MKMQKAEKSEYTFQEQSGTTCLIGLKIFNEN